MVRAGGHVILAIADTGVGIAPDQIAKIFEPFFTTKGVGQGTGLGLSQVYGFAQSSGGEIQVESDVGRGTVMRLLLPRTAKAVPRPAEQSVSIERVSEGRRRALLVEDDDTVATMVGAMLDELGFDHDRVASADAALVAPGCRCGRGVRPVRHGDAGGDERARSGARDHPEVADAAGDPDDRATVLRPPRRRQRVFACSSNPI